MNNKQVARELVKLAEKLARTTETKKLAASNADLKSYKNSPYLGIDKMSEGYRIYFADSPVEYLWADDKQEVEVWLNGIIQRAQAAKKWLAKL